MSLADNPIAVAAAVQAERESVTIYTQLQLGQGPGEGNYDRIQELRVADMLRAAEAAAVDEQDTMVMQEVGDKGDEMHEKIKEIRPYAAEKAHYGREAGFEIVTDKQAIVLAIDDESCCCESWGYFLTEDDTAKFIGAELRGVAITDTNRSNKIFSTNWDEFDNGADVIYTDAGDTMFVDIKTDRGTLQFVAYNAHNGYYGHQARVSSTQLSTSKVL